MENVLVNQLNSYQLFALEVTGEAMEPTLLEGDLIYVDTTIEPVSNSKDLAVLKVKGNYHVCKFTYFGFQVLLVHDNAPIQVVSAADVEIIGSVVSGDFVANKKSHIAGNDMAFV